MSFHLSPTSEIEKLAWGTDAGFYRLIPEYVVHAKTESHIQEILQFASQNHKPVTFRAAGTSLSGQAITNSILVVVGKNWENYEILENGDKIRLQPGIIGQRVNEILKPYNRKFSPDPASVKSAMVGGIVINNASGMSCGTHANSNKMLISAKIIFADGSLLDTGSEDSKNLFRISHPQFIAEIEKIRDEIKNNLELAERIKRKYSIKNVTGLPLNPFIEHHDPFEIITHLLVGSEGTLAFLAEATMQNGIEYDQKASALIFYKNSRTACEAVMALKNSEVSAVEFFDYKALLSVKDTIPEIESLPEGASALLIKIEADDHHLLAERTASVNAILQKFNSVYPAKFTAIETEYNKFWAMRSGIFPSVGSMRPLGTTCLIEDVAFPIHHLAEATEDLQTILAKHNYDDAVIYGHALEGNYHFIINQSFTNTAEVQRYDDMMNEVISLVVDKYDGSLKAEHGTGRNMAPFVEKEWGSDAYAIMKRVKYLFDPHNILNPGVIFNDDPHCHIKNLKPLPIVHPIIDKCIECGFCEVNCLTCGFTLSSRQRIIILREIARLEKTGEDDNRLHLLRKGFDYLGNATCAGDGLCSTSCPVKINTGEMIHVVREEKIKRHKSAQKMGQWSAVNLNLIGLSLKVGLNMVHGVRNVIGNKTMLTLATGMRRLSCDTIPQWTPAMPKGTHKPVTSKSSKLKVVYFPSCINQTMGTSYNDTDKTPLMQKTVTLLEKAGYEVIFPNNMNKLCCGTIWESKGMPDLADEKASELETALSHASNFGEYPILCDQSPCLYRMRHTMENLKLYEPAEFIMKFLVDKLHFTPIDDVITLHVTCSMTKMGLKDTIIELAKMCSNNVVIPEEVGCCGFAGDKGFTHPEVNRFALRKLRPQLERLNVANGYSNSRTCEIGLNTNGGVPFQNIVYLVDKVTSTK